MSAPAFWFAPRPGVLASALSPFGLLFGAIAARRMARPGFKAAVPVICIGNFVAGGAGKTPMAVFVAHMLLAQGFRPFFLSRGFGGRAGPAPVLVDPARHSSRDVGDEPLLLAAHAPVVVCADRVAGARAAIAAGANVLVMDDGLQNPALAKALGFAMVELLSTCPTNWGLTPIASLDWLEKNLLPYYPLGDYLVRPEVEALK